MKTIIFYIIVFSQLLFAQEDIELNKLLSSGKYQKIIQKLKDKNAKGIELNFDECKSLGIAYKKLMNFNNSIIFFVKAKELQPNNIELLSHLASSFSLSGNHLKAEETYYKILELDTNNITNRISLASEQYTLKKYDEAIENYTQLLEYDSTNAYFYFQLGLCKIKLNDSKKAQTYLSKSIKLNPNNQKAISLLARLFYNEEEYDKTIKVLQNALTNNAQNIQFNNLLADSFYKMRKYNEAIIKYLYVITLGDSSHTVFQKLGMTYYYLSFTSAYKKLKTRNLKLQEGIDALLKSYEIKNNNPMTTLYLGLCYKELDDYDNSIKYLEETLNFAYPDYLDQIYSNLGYAYSEKNQFKESIVSYKEALSFKPERKVLLYYLANVYDRYYADKSVALNYYRKFAKEAKDVDENLISYSLYRIKELTHEEDFWKKKKK